MLNKPNIVVLGTGGTISAVQNTKVSEHYSKPSICIKRLIKSIPEINNIVNIKCEQFSNIISNEITDNFLIKLAKKVVKLVEQKSISGIVITHGTNTIEETAYFLNLVINSKKPIILTGAMYPNNSVSSDGISNLFNAIILAAYKSSHDKGVLVTFNGTISNAREVFKNNMNAINNFTHPELGSLGNIQGSVPYFYRSPITRHTHKSEFDLRLKYLPKVHIIYTYIGCGRIQIDAALNDGARGIICIGMGKGYFPNAILPALSEAKKNGIFIVRCSRVTGGIVTKDPSLDEKYGFIAGNNLTPQKSRILLALALTKTNNQADIQRIFNEY